MTSTYTNTTDANGAGALAVPRRQPARAAILPMPMNHVIDRPAIGPLLRQWRSRRHMSQLDLALEARVSTRHLSFVETGRSRPSAELVMLLAEHLDVPLRERNGLLLAAGYAPAYGQRDLQAPEMGPVREALHRVLAGHEPYPALVVDRHWGMVAANSAIAC